MYIFCKKWLLLSVSIMTDSSTLFVFLFAFLKGHTIEILAFAFTYSIIYYLSESKFLVGQNIPGGGRIGGGPKTESGTTLAYPD